MSFDARITTDVLVIGGGGAGCRAAVAAAEYGAATVIACKAPFGRGGCTPVAAGGYAGALSHPEDSWESHFKDSVYGGGLINNQVLVEILAREARPRLLEIEQWAGVLNRNEQGRFDLRKFGGHTFPRSAISGDRTGRELLWALQKKVHKSDLIRVVDEVHITRLLVDDNGVRGAVGVQLLNGTVTIFEASVVIIATGGCGRLFSMSSAGRGNAGDGLRLGYEAGAEMVDMEFFQIFPTGVNSPQAFKAIHAGITESVRAEGARLLNARGERFMEKYDPVKLELATRDYICRCIYKEIKEGRGTAQGGVYLDMRYIPTERIESVFQAVLNRCLQFGVDVRKEPVEVRPLPHYQNGGIKIDEWGRTRIQGLYACGEAAGGVHGGNRLGSNSLPDLLVFGRRAGMHAGEYARTISPSAPDSRQISEAVEDLRRPLLNPKGLDPYTVLKKLHATTDQELQIVRTETGLTRCLAVMEEIEAQLEAVSVSGALIYNDLWATTMELKSRIVVGQMMARASLMRKESRASLFIEEYPVPDRAVWDKNIVVTRANGGMHLHTQPLVVTAMDPKLVDLPKFPTVA